MKVALVNPRVESFSSILPPLGLLYIGAVLEREHEVRIFDPLPGDEKILQEIVKFQPEVIGISILTSYLKRAKCIISNLKEKLPAAFFAAGGVHPTALPDNTLDYFKVDCVVLGEGEETMREICRKIERGERWQDVRGIAYRDKTKKLIKTNTNPLIENLDGLPFPARHLINFKRYLFPPGIIRGEWSERSTTMMTSRGCPYRCIWCGSHIIFGKRVRRRSVPNVLEEMGKLIRDYGIDSIWFVDDTFTLDKGWVLSFTEGIRQRKIRLKWGCQARVDAIDKEMLVAMKQSGAVQLDFGVESGSNRVLRMLKKGTNTEMVKQAFQTVRELKLRNMASFMIGSPGETRKDIEETLKLARAIKPNYVSFYFTTPFPGTELMSMAKENGWIKEFDYEKAGLKKSPMMEINFTKDELIRLRSYLQNKFTWDNYSTLLRNPKYIFKLLICVVSYPRGLLMALLTFLKTRVFDDLIFEFLVHYADKKQR